MLNYFEQPWCKLHPSSSDMTLLNNSLYRRPLHYRKFFSPHLSMKKINYTHLFFYTAVQYITYGKFVFTYPDHNPQSKPFWEKQLRKKNPVKIRHLPLLHLKDTPFLSEKMNFWSEWAIYFLRIQCHRIRWHKHVTGSLWLQDPERKACHMFSGDIWKFSFDSQGASH